MNDATTAARFLVLTVLLTFATSGCLEITRQQTSDAGTPQADPCEPTTERCDGQVAQVCNGDQEWITKQTCTPEGFCIRGSCVASAGQDACVDVLSCVVGCRQDADPGCFQDCVDDASQPGGELFGQVVECAERAGCDLEAATSFYEFSRCIVEEGCADEASNCLSGVGVQGVDACDELVAEAVKSCKFFDDPSSQCARSKMQAGSPEGQTWFFGYATCIEACNDDACVSSSCGEFTGPGSPCGVLPGIGL